MKISLSFVILGLLATAGVDADQQMINDMLCKVNQYRAQYGRRPLGLDDSLSEAAQRHSGLMAQKQDMEHQLAGEQELFSRIDVIDPNNAWRRVAENIAWGQSDVGSVMDSWIKSPGHRANILGDYTHFGCGVQKAGNNKYYWTQDFSSDKKQHNFPICPTGSSPSLSPSDSLPSNPISSPPVGVIPAPAPSAPATSTCTKGQARCDGSQILRCKGHIGWATYNCPSDYQCQLSNGDASCQKSGSGSKQAHRRKKHFS